MHKSIIVLIVRILLLSVFGLSFVLIPKTAFSQDLTLPTYRIEMNPSDLERMNLNPELPNLYDATIRYEGEDYRANVKFRGASALRLPKRSWRLEFKGDSPGELEAINLDAEYNDRSIARDYLSTRLGEMLGLPAPNQRFVSLIVNNVYFGVYMESEVIDQNFMRRRGLGENEIFAIINHMGRGAPFLNESQFKSVYELQEGRQIDYDRLGQCLTFLHYASHEEITREFAVWFDIDNVLKYFALQYMIGNWDGFAKNYHLVRRDDDRYLFVPWDCDGTFGNDWAGNWTNDYSRLYFDLLNMQTVFRRVMELEGSRDRFVHLVDQSAERLFPGVDSLVQALYEDIRHDAYLDNRKRATREEFDVAFTNLRSYLRNRSEALRGVEDYFDIPLQPRIEVSGCYLSDPGQEIDFTAEIDPETRLCFLSITDSAGTMTGGQMFDNGSSGDNTAGDGIYTIAYNPVNLVCPLYYNLWLYNNDHEGYPFPRGGLYLQSILPLQMPIIMLNADPPESGDIAFTCVEEVMESAGFLIGLINIRERTIDLSGCTVSLNQSYRRTMLPQIPDIVTGDTLWLTNRQALMRCAFPMRTITGTLYFHPQPGDTIILSRPDGGLITESVYRRSRRVGDAPASIVINEINYHSHEDFDTDDWIELTAINGTHDLAGWRLSDSRNDNYYSIPAGIRLSQGEFLVLARDPEKVQSLFETPGPVIGGFSFSLDNSSDDVRLFNSAGEVVDWVCYADDGLWPSEADGSGATLELVNPSLSNYGWQYWEASQSPYRNGSPGQQNGAYRVVEAEIPAVFPAHSSLIYAFPNPFNDGVRIDVQIGAERFARLAIYDIIGRKIDQVNEKRIAGESISFYWKPNAELATGIYYVGIENQPAVRQIPLLYLK